MKELIKSNITGKRIILLFLLTNTIYALMVLITIPKVMAFAGGMKLFDMMPMGYSVDYAEKLLVNLGQEGREAYLYRQIPLDMLYPLLSGITYCLMTIYLLIKLELFDKSWTYLSFLPVLAGLLDYSENMGIITMLSSFPGISSSTIQINSILSVMKSGLYAASFSVVILLFLLLVVKRLKNRKL